MIYRIRRILSDLNDFRADDGFNIVERNIARLEKVIISTNFIYVKEILDDVKEEV